MDEWMNIYIKKGGLFSQYNAGRVGKLLFCNHYIIVKDWFRQESSMEARFRCGSLMSNRLF